MQAFYETNRFGSARWAEPRDLHQAGLSAPRRGGGPVLGFYGGAALRVDGDAPIITIGGAGSGKLRDVLAYAVCGMPDASGRWHAPPRLFVNDSRGELAAISIHNHLRLGKDAWCFNPMGLHGLPRHRTNPLDMLTPDSATLHADIKLLCADLIPLSGSANAEFFELRARQFVGALLHMLVERDRGATLPGLYDAVNAVQDAEAWPAIGNAMLFSAHAEVRRTAIEIHTKRDDAPKEFSGILGEIVKALDFLGDPAIREALSGSDFSLSILCREDCSVFNIIPAEYAAQLAPLNRLVMGAAILPKFRAPAAPRVLFLIDDAATLGRFESLLRCYSYGRGMGLRAWSVWQDVGQLTRNFGPGALSSFLGSSQTRQFFGVRDLETAKLVSAMLGQQTLQVNMPMDQAAGRRTLARAAGALLQGADPLSVGLDAWHGALAASTPTQQARALMTPDEILAMPEDKQILFVSGLGVPPIYADKTAYFARRDMAGGYMPNPYHPPPGAVWVQERHGRRLAPVITAPVPARFAGLPQYQSGEWTYIAGYRPL